MAKTLSEFTQQAMEAYAPAKQALQNQLDALSGQLAETEAGINRQFTNQQKELDTQRQTASSVASMQAAGSGGSFGGKANIANRNYYRDTFVPAVARLQTNQANALSEARRQNQNQRLSLQSQLANLLTQANTSSISRYDDWNRFDQNMAWDKDKFGQTMAWDKEKFNRQLAESRAARAQAAAESNRLFNYRKEQDAKKWADINKYYPNYDIDNLDPNSAEAKVRGTSAIPKGPLKAPDAGIGHAGGGGAW